MINRFFTRFFSWLVNRLQEKTVPRFTIRNVDSPATLSTKGNTTTLKTDGSLEVDLKKIRLTSVGIKNLVDVTEHHITTIVGSRSHLVRFVNGGELQFAYNASGQLIELSTFKLTVTLSPKNAISIGVAEESQQVQETVK